MVDNTVVRHNRKKSKSIRFVRERGHGRTKEAKLSERRQGGPATCDRGQIRVETRFALNEDEVSYLPADHRPKLFWVRHREMLVFLQTPKRYQCGGTFRIHSDCHKIFQCILYLRQTDTNGVVRRRPRGCARRRRTGTAQHHRGGAKRTETWRGWVK